MPTLDHESTPPEQEDAQASRHNARLGLVMFFIYFAVYAGFMILNTFSPETMKVTIAGVNLAIIYGLGLIVLAVVMAVVYLMLCRSTK